MDMYQLPKAPLYNGEDSLPQQFRGDEIAAQQWVFEKHYANSAFALGVSFSDRFLRGPGFEQYQFFRGGQTPPGWMEEGAYKWWAFEKSHWESYGIHKEESPFILYFREWVFAKVAADSGYAMFANLTNRWLDEYLEFAPMTAIDI